MLCNAGMSPPGLAAWMAALRLIMSQGCSPAARRVFMLSCLLLPLALARGPSPPGQRGGPGAGVAARRRAAADMATSRSSLERLVGENRGCSSARWSIALPARIVGTLQKMSSQNVSPPEE